MRVIQFGFGGGEDNPHRRMVRLALSSNAALAIVPAQDLLGLGADARFNTPGTAVGNWEWRLEPGTLDARLARWVREATEDAGRIAPAP
jgi:4-alpha-glucanotransferase